MAEKQRRGNAFKTVGLLALGAAVGSGIALLFAPAPGYVTRRKLAMKIRQARRVASEKIEERLNVARGWILERMTNGSGNGRHASRHRTVHQHS